MPVPLPSASARPLRSSGLLPAVACSLALLTAAGPLHAAGGETKAKTAKTVPQTMNGLPLIVFEDFESGADKWEPTDAEAWKIEKEEDGNHVFSQFKKRSNYNPPFRSPYNRAMLRDVHVGSFVLDARLRSTHPDYGHRDLCLFFGQQDESHLYYVHLGKKMDDHANQIFIVDEAPRTKISTKTTEGTNWDDEWHHVRIVRDVKSGSIQVFYDDMKTPVMTAENKAFTWGRVGVGSFDDTGHFDNFALYGEKVEPKQ
ncbi:MAG: hypothetical protein KDA79_15780, partial [Planctomycetaceae bacterium]|nr:hypothetical protein [Planctomycetaceae bacterium]